MSIRLPSPFLTIFSLSSSAPSTPTPISTHRDAALLLLVCTTAPVPPHARMHVCIAVVVVVVVVVAAVPPSPYPFPLAAGVRGTITRFVTTIPSASSTYHFYELDVQGLDADWLESKERRREWVDYAEASRRLAWKAELVQGLSLSSLAPNR